MANLDAAFGLKPVRYLNGTPYNGQARKYHVKSDYATALYIGTVVDLTGTSSSVPLGAYPDVQIATFADTNYTIGPIVACEPLYSDLTKVYHPASTDGYVFVADDPNIIFEVQVDNAAANLTPADIGQNAILITGTDSTITGLSGDELDENTTAGNASLMIMILNIVNRPDNEMVAAGSANVNVEVLISGHRYLNELAAVGGRLGA